MKATILALLDEDAAGEEVQITKHGRIVARLVPASGPPAVGGARGHGLQYRDRRGPVQYRGGVGVGVTTLLLDTHVLQW